MEVRKPAIILACDIDRTLIAGTYEPAYREEADESLNALHAAIARTKYEADFPFLFGTVTGRTPASHEQLEKDHEAFGAIMGQADFKITSVGARISLKNTIGEFASVDSWPHAPGWDREAIKSTLTSRPELDYQDDIAQDTHKVSFDVHGVDDIYYEQYITDVQQHLGYAGILANAIFSGGRYLDILPLNTHKGTSILHAAPLLVQQYRPQYEDIQNFVILGAGDSMNDADLLAASDIAIKPSNADVSLDAWTAQLPEGRLYKARSRYGAAILECMHYYNLAA